MPAYLKFLWGNPSPLRLAASCAIGVALAVCSAGSPIWLFIFILILILRTHIISLFFGFGMGKILALFSYRCYEAVGKDVLISHKIFWQDFLAKPFICYLNLNKAAVMGNLIVAVALAFFFFFLFFVPLFFLKKITLQKYIDRRDL